MYARACLWTYNTTQFYTFYGFLQHFLIECTVERIVQCNLEFQALNNQLENKEYQRQLLFCDILKNKVKLTHSPVQTADPKKR